MKRSTMFSHLALVLLASGSILGADAGGQPGDVVLAKSADQPVPLSAADAGGASGTGYGGHFSCRDFAGQERALAAAISDRQPRQVQALIHEGADVNARSTHPSTHHRTILQTAVLYGWGAESVQLLISSGADTNLLDDRGDTALTNACQTSVGCDPQVVSLLLQAGASIDSRNSRGLTALMFAAIHDKTGKTVQQLVKARANVAAVDANGWTALMHATRRRKECPAIVSQLINAGSDINAHHRGGGTALANASYEGHVETVRLLLKAGAEVNCQDVAGWTPLTCAAINGHLQIVQLLVDAKADIHHRDGLGRTALSLARAHQHKKTESFLARLGGKQ